MKGRAFIDGVRSFRLFAANESEAMQIAHLLADAVDEADASFSDAIESEGTLGEDGWYGVAKIDLTYAGSKEYIDRAISYLLKRGLIERHPDKPNLVRFVEEK